MNRYMKYKQVARIQLFGDDDINTSTNSQYSCPQTALPAITVNSAGTNYTAASTQVLITGGGGSNATAVATVSSGGISAITVTNSGSGYTNIPNVIITSGITNTASLVGGTS
jgi:hypothetical protein